MLLLTLISGLLLILNGNCQQNQNIPNQDSSYFKSGQAADNANSSKRGDTSQTQNGNETAGFIRKDTRNSEVITIGRNDGHRTIFTTYENKGFYAHTGVDKSSPSGNHVSTPRPYPAIGGMTVPTLPTNNEFMNGNFNSRSVATPVMKGGHPVTSNTPPKAYPYQSIGGNPVEFKQNINTPQEPPQQPIHGPLLGTGRISSGEGLGYSPQEPWKSNRKLEHQTNAAGASFGGWVTLDGTLDNKNQSTSQMNVAAHAIGGRPVDLTDNMYSPYQAWSNNTIPKTSSSYAADPSIGGNAVPLHPNFEFNPFGSEKLVYSNVGIATRIARPFPDDLEDSSEAAETERLSWQVSVFSKEVSPYVRVCGGSIVTSTAVISAAQCFWGVRALPAGLFAVGAVPVDNPNNTRDEYGSHLQKIDVRTIRIPPRFRGASSNYQEDIAVLLLKQPFSFDHRLKPVCVSFDPALDERQLADGSQGTILGTSLAATSSSLILRNHRVPVIGIEQCLREAADEYLQYITSDKICAGVQSAPPNASICFQDIGSGLAFTSSHKNAALPVLFLRGVASSPLFSAACSAYRINAYTHIQSHRAFILQHVPDIERECPKHYPHVFTLLNHGNIGNDGSQSEDEESDSDEGQFVCNCFC